MSRRGGAALAAAMLTVGLAGSLAGCGKSEEEQAEASAAVQNFTPPFVMSRLDFGGVVERRFRRLDRNEDDRIDRTEISPRLAPRFAEIDANGDGSISNEEWSHWMLARFDHQDENKDGIVTSAEREKAREQREMDLPTPAEEPATNMGAAAK